MKKFSARRAAIFGLMLALVLCFASVAMASSLASAKTMSYSIPWNTGIATLISALSGQTALYISMIGLFFAGGILIFGGDLGNFGRMAMMVVLVGSTLTGLNALIQNFLTAGALL